MHQLKFNQESGFTLIEMIAALIILGIMAIALSSAIMYGVQNLISARDAAQISQKAQLALARINRELVDLNSVNAASTNNNSIQYTLSTGGEFRIRFLNSQILLAGINPAVAEQVLLGGLDATNGGNNFLTYTNFSGSAWTTADPINQLARLNIIIVINLAGTGQLHQNQLLSFTTTVNPRRNGVQNAPSLN